MIGRITTSVDSTLSLVLRLCVDTRLRRESHAKHAHPMFLVEVRWHGKLLCALLHMAQVNK